MTAVPLGRSAGPTGRVGGLLLALAVVAVGWLVPMSPRSAPLLTFVLPAAVLGLCVAREATRDEVGPEAGVFIGYAIFLVLAPLQQVAGGTTWPTGVRIDLDAVVATNVRSTVWLLVFSVPTLWARLGRRPAPRRHPPVLARSAVPSAALLGLAVVVLVAVSAAAGTDFLLGRVRLSESIGSVSTRQAVAALGQGASYAVLVVVVQSWRHASATARVMLGLSATIAVALTNPLNTPRYAIGAIGLGVALAGWPHLRRPRRFLLVFALLFLLLFPTLNVFKGRDARTLDAATLTDLTASYRLDLSDLNFDAYGNMASSDLVLDRQGYGHGRYVASVLGFWVPRAVWTDKSEGFGVEVADAIGGLGPGGHHRNLAAPIVAEHWADGGFVALVLLALATGGAFRLLDRRAGASLRWMAVGFAVYLVRGSPIAAVSSFAGAALFLWSIETVIRWSATPAPAGGEGA